MSRRGPTNVIAVGPNLNAIEINWIWVVRRTLLNLEIFFTIIVSIISAIFSAVIETVRVLFTGIFWYVVIGLLLWYIVVTLWIWFASLVVLVGIPAYNIIVVIFNLFAEIIIQIARIVIMLWNMFVPFIGMIITFIVDVVVKILSEIFNEIGSINFEPLINALMQILVPIVQVAMQILLVLIKVGIEVITELSDVIGAIVEAILTFVKVLLPILTWILKLLYDILEPILALIGFFFGSIGGSDDGGARRLLSTQNKGILDFSGPVEEDTVLFEDFVMEQLGENALGRAPSTDEYLLKLYMETKGGKDPPLFSHGTSAGRDILANERDSDSFFNRDDPLRFKEVRDPHNDDKANIVGDFFYRSARSMPQSDISLAQVTMQDIFKATRGKAGLHLRTILATHKADIPQVKKTLAHLRYPGTPVHPAVMHEKWLRESGPFDQFVAGRKLMFQSDDPMFNKTEHKIAHAKAIVKQQEAYINHHLEVTRVATKVHNIAQDALLEGFRDTLTPQAVIDGGNAMLESMEFSSVKEALDYFKDTYQDAQGLIKAMHEATNIPFLNIFKRKQDRASPLFSGSWQDHGRRLMQSDQQDVRRGETGGAWGGMPIVSTLGCNAKPPNRNNPLCVPQIPRNFSVALKQIKITEKERRQLLHDPKLCPPWKYTLCFPYCVDRLWNAWQTVRFILSAIPPVNYAVAGYTKMFPLFSWVFDWMFMVPKFKTARLIQWTCFAFHLYDLVITVALAIFLWIFLRPFLLIFTTTWTRIQTARARTLPPFFLDTLRQREVESMVTQLRQDRGMLYTHSDGRGPVTEEQRESIRRQLATQRDLTFNHSTVEIDQEPST